MANLHLVTGFAGTEHVTSADQGALNAAMFGNGQFVLGQGNRFSASIVDNNTIRVYDGDMLMQGRYIRMAAETYVDLTIENGTQGEFRNDLVVARYTVDTNTGVEEVNLVVIKGTPADADPVDPEYTVGDIINDNVILNDMPLYRVKLNGVVTETAEPMFEVSEFSMRSLKEELDALTFEATVTVSETWTEDTTNGGFYQTVSVDGILATDNPVVDVVLGSDIEANKLYKDAWKLVDRVVAATNSVTLYVNNSLSPSTAFTMFMKAVR